MGNTTIETTEIILEVSELSVRKASVQVLADISFTLKKGDHLAITGAAGSGKTSLALALAGKIFSTGKIHYAGDLQQGIVWVEQEHHFKNLSNTSSFYYQQRFNSADAEDALTVAEYLGRVDISANELLRPFEIDRLMDKPLIQLSNGENKKVQIARALLSSPAVLVLDQPFVGLDIAARASLHQRIDELATKGMLIILVTQPLEIPACITKVISLEKSGPFVFMERAAFDKQVAALPQKKTHQLDESLLKRLLAVSANGQFNAVIRMKDVQVSYGDKQILKDVNWEVKEGERWLLSGPNGAGKSTLLSLITADNPQAYANDIYLFDRKRGSGESIWDIKKRIGYLSPELLLFFESSNSVFEAVASGLFDTIGLFRQLSDEQMKQVYDWLGLLGIKSLARKRLNELSAGEQRRALLARALIKNPPLLILDEPCQGLDEETEADILELINSICVEGNKTLIYVTHYANNRPACVDKGIQLDKGCVIKNGAL
jgi:molybdate transport system ATP-binding protein